MPLAPAARAYILAVLATAVVSFAAAVAFVPHDRFGRIAIVLVLFVFAGRISEHKHHASTDSHATLGPVIVLAALLLTGPAGGVLVAGAALPAQTPDRPLLKRLFNTAQLVLATGAAGAAMVACGGTANGLPRALAAAVMPALVANVVLCLGTAVLVAGVLAITSDRRLLSVVRGFLEESGLTVLGYGLIGVGLAFTWDFVGVGPASVVLLLAPLLAARRAYALYADLREAHARATGSLVAAVEIKDVYTRGHSERVSKASVMIARERRMPEARIASLKAAGILHDVGKLGVATRVLQKTSSLTDEEFDAVKTHPTMGHEILAGIDFLEDARAGILHHHERMDGRGYPLGLKGYDIPEFARIISVADAFDSMTSTRSYRSARSVDVAIAELRRCAGPQFDPDMVDALIRGLVRTPWEPTTDPAVPVVTATIPRPRGHYDEAARAGDVDGPESVA